MINAVILAVSALILVGMVGFAPDFLAGNVFLKDFMDADALALFGVMVSITIAGAANLVVSLRGTVVSVDPDGTRGLRKILNEVMGEVISDFWHIFWSLILAFFVIFSRGFVAESESVTSAAFAMVLWLFILVFVSMADMYRVAFAVAKQA